MDEKELESGLSLIDIFIILKKNIILMIGIIIVITILGIAYSFTVTPKYAAKASVMVQVKDSGGTSSSTDVTTSLRIVATVAEFMKSDLVCDTVADEEGITLSGAQIQKGLSTSYDTTSLNIFIKFTTTDEAQCDDVLNQVITTSQFIANTTEKEPGVPYYTVIKNTISMVSDASTPVKVSPNKTLYAIISFVIGVVVAVGVAMCKELFNTKINSIQELENNYNLKVIGTIPDFAQKGGNKNA